MDAPTHDAGTATPNPSNRSSRRASERAAHRRALSRALLIGVLAAFALSAVAGISARAADSSDGSGVSSQADARDDGWGPDWLTSIPQTYDAWLTGNWSTGWWHAPWRHGPRHGGVDSTGAFTWFLPWSAGHVFGGGHDKAHDGGASTVAPAPRPTDAPVPTASDAPTADPTADATTAPTADPTATGPATEPSTEPTAPAGTDPTTAPAPLPTITVTSAPTSEPTMAPAPGPSSPAPIPTPIPTMTVTPVPGPEPTPPPTPTPAPAPTPTAPTMPTPTPPAAPTPPASDPPTVSSPSPSGVAMPVGDLPGWKQVYSDDFTGGSLNSDWGEYTGQPGGDPSGYWLQSHVEVSDGLLALQGYADSGHDASGGVAAWSATQLTYGKYEVRFRADVGHGYGYVFLLWPASGNWPTDGEIDFAEDGASDRQSLAATLHYGASNAQIAHGLDADFSQWHTVGVEWTKGSLIYTLDGKPWATVTGSQVPSTPMFLAMQEQALPCTSWSTCVDSSTPAQTNVDIDWISVYAPE